MLSAMGISHEEYAAAVALISRYARSLDAADVAGLLACFTNDVSLEYENGRIVVKGLTEADAFFSKVLGGPSTHLLSNYEVGRADSDVVATCSAIACVCRKAGLVTVRGLAYTFTCSGCGPDMRISQLQHSMHWEFDAPGATGKILPSA